MEFPMKAPRRFAELAGASTRGRRCRSSAATTTSPGGRHAGSSPTAVAHPHRGRICRTDPEDDVTMCARASLGNGRAARLGTIPLCGALGSLRFSRRRSFPRHDTGTTGRRGRRPSARARARCLGVDVNARPRPPYPQRRGEELARRRSRSATPNDHRSTTRRSISRTCANCPGPPSVPHSTILSPQAPTPQPADGHRRTLPDRPR
ncbi:hypothetical protein DBV15_06660 [Temnothorax longispinosus]|uniref:Uncharacterized protein n=1 Tax=Temnothorax longispinosus TaxID=300112 RepID=A0A4S2KLX3_9HYME|nr:hypothetical protein DBV15_06660 [Temnothorax longispinosus]